MPAIKILVVDDHTLVRKGLMRMLGDVREFVVVGEAESGELALVKIETLADVQQLPDIVLMDMRMPGMGGIEATRKITHRYPKTKVIAISSFSAAPFPQRFIENGALGYLTKDATIDEVVTAIYTVCRGKRYISHPVAQQLAINTVTGNNGSPFSLLSERELQIALMVIDGVKTADIGGTLKVSPKTVNTYRYRLFDKLNIRSNMELAMLASRHGLLMADDI